VFSLLYQVNTTLLFKVLISFLSSFYLKSHFSKTKIELGNFVACIGLCYHFPTMIRHSFPLRHLSKFNKIPFSSLQFVYALCFNVYGGKESKKIKLTSLGEALESIPNHIDSLAFLATFKLDRQ
jgi:hypothetical protein